MDKFIIAFYFILLVSRFFSETLGVAPKAIDLLDMLVVPFLLFIAVFSGRVVDADRKLDSKILRLTVVFIVICILSSLINYDRTHIGPVLLYIFGFLEGPMIFVILNRVIRAKKRFGDMMGRFLNTMVLVEIATVAFVSIPIFLATGNPDKVSGTFGNNAYQFSAFLVVMGGYFLGRQTTSKKSLVYTVAIQIFIFFTFVLLQFRAGVPAFFATYGVMAAALYGRKIIRLGLIVGIFAVIGYMAFSFVQEQDYKLKYEDFETLLENPEAVLDYGKALSYVNTYTLMGEEPMAIVIGTGPGTFVSRANYTFTTEMNISKEKGVGPILKAVFGDVDYSTEIQKKYIDPLLNMGTLFGSVQVNNPNSSILAVFVETGIPGLLVIAILYGSVIALARKHLILGKKVGDPVLIQLSCALLGGVTYLLMVSPLDNYMEMGRITLPIWLLFWTVTTLGYQRKLTEATLTATVQQPVRSMTRQRRRAPLMTRS